MNYQLAIEKFQELQKEITNSLSKDNFHFDVNICDNLYQKVLFMVETFCHPSRKKELQRTENKNRAYNNATKIEGLQGFVNNIIEELKLHDETSTFTQPVI